MFAKKALYGGCISTVIPTGFLDASTIRPVPDTQEVFVNNRRSDAAAQDGLGTTESIIFDLLERVAEDNDRKALDVHLAEISSLNNRTYTLLHAEQLQNVQKCILAQTPATAAPAVPSELLFVGLIRLSDVETDVLVTVNLPVSAQDLPDLHALLRTAASNPAPVRTHPRAQACFDLLSAMLQGFAVEDRSLFLSS